MAGTDELLLPEMVLVVLVAWPSITEFIRRNIRGGPIKFNIPPFNALFTFLDFIGTNRKRRIMTKVVLLLLRRMVRGI